MWAPEIHENRAGGTYIVYFAGRKIGSNKHCIGAAVSTTSNILGPYKDLGEPLVVNNTGVGVIDVTHFYDVDGTPYLIWKTEQQLQMTQPLLI